MLRRPRTKRSGWAIREVFPNQALFFLKNSQIVRKNSQFGMESMLSVIHLQPILEDEFCFLGDCTQFRMFVDVAGSQNGIGKTLQAVLQFGDSLRDLGRGHLRPYIGIEGNFAFDLLNVLGDSGLAFICRMAGLRSDALQWIAFRHGIDCISDIGQSESPAKRTSKRVPLIRDIIVL